MPPASAITTCPSDELLAAFVDSRLSVDERHDLMNHLADCARCRELVSSVAAHRELPRTADVLKFTRRSLTSVVLATAAAAVFAAVFWPRSQSSSHDAPELVDLVRAMGAARPVEARLTGGFEYAPIPRGTRSAGSASRPEVRIAIARVRDAAVERPSISVERAAAIADLIELRFDSAISRLERVRRDGSLDAKAASDLAAAYLARGRDGDLQSALGAIDAALQMEPALPEAWFNKGLTHERMGRIQDALVAWKRYLELDSRTEWAAEAKAHTQQDAEEREDLKKEER